MADAGESVEPERIGRRLRDEGRPVGAGDVRPVASPRIARAVESAARRFLPFRLGGQAIRRAVRGRQPFAIAHRLEPVDAHHGLMRIGEARITPPRRRRRVRGREEARVPVIGDGTSRDLESIDPDAMSGTLARMSLAPSHPEPARGDFHELQGREIIHLEIGEPDFDTPRHIREAGKQALDDGATHYGPAAGLPELREAIAKDMGATRNIPVSPEEIVVTPGAKPIMYFVITALVNPGDEVIYPNPGFPIYESVINFVGGKPVPIPLREESDFGFDMAAFEKAVSTKTKLIIINSPQNPTGGVLG